MKQVAQYLAVFLFFFLLIFGGADVDNISYLLAILGVAILGIITIIILVVVDNRRHPPITTADLIKKMNFDTHQEIIKSARRSL
ncbi:MAG: hypothetical protein PHW01_01175 [Patescibacteria group bacterium]|nr:hypothetical protein [Patescibacteria group bacterium]